MNFFSEIVKNLFNKDLEGIYAFLFLIFVIAVISFIIWAIYYMVAKKGLEELSKVEWLSLRETIQYSTLSISVILLASIIFLAFDFGIDSIIGLII